MLKTACPFCLEQTTLKHADTVFLMEASDDFKCEHCGKEFTIDINVRKIYVDKSINERWM